MKLLKPTGPISANIMVITDYPQSGDFVKQQVFSSSHGWLFGKMLEDIGGRKDSMYITSTVLHAVDPDKKTLKNKRSLLRFIAENSRSCENILAEINAVKPNVIITVGDWPLQYLTGNDNVKKFQGSILSLLPNYDNEHIKVIPIQHPRDIFKVYSGYYYTPVYLKRAIALRDDPLPHREKLHIEIINNFQSVHNYFKQNRDAPFIVGDIETFYNLISCIGFSLTPDTAIVIPFLEDNINPYEMCEILKLIQKAFDHFPYVNQNASFDQIRIERFGWRIKNVLGDTMLNASVLYPELPKNLGFINSLHTNIPYFKDEAKDYSPGPKLYNYCGKDAISTNQIYRAQLKEADELQVKPFIQKHMMKFYPVYRDMQTQGIQVDGKIKQELIENYELMLTGYVGDIKEAVGYDLNPLSPKQCHQLIYEELKLPVQKKRRADGDQTDTADEDAIDFLLLNCVEDDATRDVLQKIVYTRKIKKILNHLNIPLHPGDIFASSFNLAGTETGRTSTSKSGDNFYVHNEGFGLSQTKLGFAFQTIPKHGFELADGTRLGADIRKMFVPRPGYIFAEGDQSKAEAVIVTVLAKDWDLYDKFYTINLHKITAVAVFGLAHIDQVSQDQYNKGKRVRHAANYDMKEVTLAKQALCAVHIARKLLDKFHEENWRIRGNFHRSVKDFVTKYLWLNTPYGRRRDFFVNPKNDNFVRKAYAYIPQSVVSDKTKIAMYESAEILKQRKIDYHFLGESHDSVLSEVREGQELEYSAILKDRIEQPIDMRKCCIPRDIDAVIRFECATGYNWKDLKEIKLNERAA